MDRPNSPKFVVTLDGVDTEAMDENLSFDSSMDVDSISLSGRSLRNGLAVGEGKNERNIVKVKPQRQHSPITQVTVNLNDSDGRSDTSLKLNFSAHFWSKAYGKCPVLCLAGSNTAYC